MENEFRVRGSNGGFVYRKTAASAARNGKTGETIYQKDDYGSWEDVGMAYRGNALLGEDYARVSQIWPTFFSNRPEVPQIVDLYIVREIKIPGAKCGLTNFLAPFFQAGIIEQGPEDFRTLGTPRPYTKCDFFHYVVTDDGARILRLAVELKNAPEKMDDAESAAKSSSGSTPNC